LSVSADKRTNILTQKEIQDFYGFSRLPDEERMIYFALTLPEQKLVDTHRSIASKVCCILQLGYFKASKMFYVFGFFIPHSHPQLPKNPCFSIPNRLTQAKNFERHQSRNPLLIELNDHTQASLSQLQTSALQLLILFGLHPPYQQLR